MTNTIHIESFGPTKFYGRVVPFVINNRKLWRKVARLVSKLRRDTRVWPTVDRQNQLKEAELYVNQALKDTKLPPFVSQTLRLAINAEYKFSL
jgi:hypothetical protein